MATQLVEAGVLDDVLRRTHALARTLTAAHGLAVAILQDLVRAQWVAYGGIHNASVRNTALDTIYPQVRRHIGELRQTVAVADALRSELDNELLESSRRSESALKLAVGLNLEQILAIVHTVDRLVARDVDQTLVHARELAENVAQASTQASASLDRLKRATFLPPGIAAGRRLRPSAVATQLTRRAARVLPLRHQRRYAEEFDAELHELAAAGASRAQQIVYGLRLIDRTWVLRAELREADQQQSES